MMGHAFSWNFGGMLLMGLFWAAVIGLIIWLAVRAGRSGCCMPQEKRGDSPLDIAKERFARGEIDAEQFEKLKKDLS